MNIIIWILLFGVSGIAIALYLFRNKIRPFVRTIVDLASLKLKIFIIERLEAGLLIKKKGNHYDLIYFDGIHKYIVRFPKHRGPSKYQRIFTTTEGEGGIRQDVTHVIKEYAGPSHNFHGIVTTPHTLGYKNLTFVLNSEEERHFGENDVILF
jgi:hypothetical protein